jgi:putative DNA primase/helicase
VIPVHLDGRKRPAVKWSEYQTVRPTRARLSRWFAQWPSIGFGIVTGTVTDIVVLDLDGEAGERTREQFGLEASVHTPSGGCHVYVRQPAFKVKTIARPDPEHFPNLDIRGEGGVAVFYGRTERGAYEYIADARIYELSELPAALRQLLEQQRRDHAVHSQEFELPEGYSDFEDAEVLVQEAVAAVGGGSARNDTGFRLACQLRDEGIDAESAFVFMRQYQSIIEDEGDHPYREQEAYDSLRSAFTQPRRPPRRLEHDGRDFLARTDLGNAERLLARHGMHLRYCHDQEEWLVWNGRQWQTDRSGEVSQRAIDTVRQIRAAARLEPDDATRQALMAFGRACESSGRLSALIRVAQDLPGVDVPSEYLNMDPWLLNVRNGTLDLRTGTLRAHDPADLITLMAPVAFDARAVARLWKRWLRQMIPDRATRRYLQRAIGYSLTGVIEDHVFHILYGTGRNGKSLFLRIMLALLGDYAQQAPSELLIARRASGPTPEVARLAGRRFVAATETNEGSRLDEAMIKQLTGGDRVVARNLYEGFGEFAPTAKLWLATNDKPNVKGTTDAIWRRIRLVPFTVTITEEEEDPGLFEILMSEVPGILNWALEGLTDWQQHGLSASGAIAAATNEYRQDQDVVGQFLRECCTEDPDRQIAAKVLYEAFREWQESNGYQRPWTQNRFGRFLGRFELIEVHAGPHRKKYVRCGLTLNEVLEDERREEQQALADEQGGEGESSSDRLRRLARIRRRAEERAERAQSDDDA